MIGTKPPTRIRSVGFGGCGSSVVVAWGFAARLRLTLRTLGIKPALLRRLRGSGRSSWWGFGPRCFLENGIETTNGALAVGCLRAGPVLPDTNLVAKLLHKTLPHCVIERCATSEVECQFGTRRTLVCVLPSRSPRGPEPPLELRRRNLEPHNHPFPGNPFSGLHTPYSMSATLGTRTS